MEKYFPDMEYFALSGIPTKHLKHLIDKYQVIG